MRADERIVAVVREIVTKHARNPVPRVEEHHALGRDLGFDSLAFLLTLSDLEDRLGFHLPLEEVDQLRDISFGDLVRRVERDSGSSGRDPSLLVPVPS